MLYVFLGNDIKKIRQSVEKIVSRDKNSSVFEFDDLNWDSGEVQNLIGTRGLFGGRTIVIMRRVYEKEEAQIFLEENFSQFVGSDTDFVFIEENLPKKTKDELEKKGAILAELTIKSAKVDKKQFNIFSITDALGMRNRKKAWVLFEEAQFEGVSPEEIHPILFWQVKSMLAALKATSPIEAGLKPFVYSKSKRYAGNFSENELIELSRSLVKVHTESRLGKSEFGSSLERFILSI